MTETSTCGWDVSVEEEYRRVPQLNPAEVEMIMEWASKQPHLPQIPKHRVAMFLRACDFSLERTKDTIELFFTIRAKVPELFSNLDTDSYWIKTALRNVCVGMIKDSKDDFYFYYKLTTSDNMNEWKFEEYARAVLLCVETTHLTLGSGDGYHFIADVKEFTLSHMLQTPLTVVQHILKFLQDASHYKIKSIHFMNGGTVIERLYQLAKPFIHKKVQELVRIHPGTETLFDSIEAAYVPKEYGGKGPALRDLDAEMKEVIVRKKKFFKKDCLLVTDISKRPPTSRCDYGIVGSFRKMAID